MARRRKRGTTQRDKQSGRAVVRESGDQAEITFPDGGARPLKKRILKYQDRPRDGFGSHHNGRNKLG